MYYLELDGSQSLFKTYPALEISWHKTKKEVYCYSACLIFESLVASTPIRVSITTTAITSPASEQKRISQSIITRYFSCKSENGLTHVPLNSTELVEAIELCEYTKDSKGQNKHLIHYPSEIKFSYSGNEESCFFNPGLPPLLICRDLLMLTEYENKIAVHINLKSKL